MKQDVVPGMDQYMWFKARVPDQVDIVCAELCGWGHYKMKARATFLPRKGTDGQPGFDDWLASKYAEQHERRAPAVAADEY
jgi:cytochrome c oxidase subunit 2